MKDNVERKESGPAWMDKTEDHGPTEYQYNFAIREAMNAYDDSDLAEEIDDKLLTLCKTQNFEAAGKLLCQRMNETIVRRAKIALCLPEVSK
jgi:hypothetical protein